MEKAVAGSAIYPKEPGQGFIGEIKFQDTKDRHTECAISVVQK